MRQKRLNLIGVLVVLLSLALTACSSATNTPAASRATESAPTSAPTAKPSGAAVIPTNVAQPTVVAERTQLAGSNVDRVVIAQGSDPVTLDPNNHNDTPTGNILTNMYETLVTRSPDLQLRPLLAESWKQIDNLTWEFKLRKGVKWHDGTDFTADDVKYTYDRYLDTNRKPAPIVRYTNLSAFLKETVVVDPLTVQIKTSAPTPILVIATSGEAIVSKKYFSEKGDEFTALNPMGTGPYKFKEYQKAKFLDMDINPAYWGAAPKVQAVRWRAIPDANTRISALQAGEIDIATNIPPEQISQLEASDKVGLTTAPSARVFFAIINTQEAGSPLANVKVRQALNMAIDRDAIIKSLYKGNAIKINGLLTESHFGYNPDLPEYKFDPAKAKQLLTEAGYPNGIDITFDYPTGRYSKDKETAEVIVSQWAEIGVRAKAASPEWTQYSAQTANRKHGQIFLLGWGNSLWDADQTLRRLLGKGEARAYWDNEPFNKLINDALTTLDPAKRLQLYKEAGVLYNQEATHIFLWQFKDTYGFNKTKIKWQARPDEAIQVSEITSAK